MKTIIAINSREQQIIDVVKEDVLKLIDEIPNHSWEGHKAILVGELKARIEGKAQ